MTNTPPSSPGEYPLETVQTLAVKVYKEMRWTGQSPEEILETLRASLTLNEKDSETYRAGLSEAFPDIGPDLAIAALKYVLENFATVQALAAVTRTKILPEKAIELGFGDRVRETLQNGYIDPDIENDGEPMN
ncbi:MAG: hypothetical protein WC604_04795 [Candidatus Gracilibacteria bacterium]